MTDREAIKQAMYLIDAWQRGANADLYFMEIAELRQALAQGERTRRVCNTCDGTGIVKDLHNWAGGGKRTESCWACHEVADEKKEPALGDADPRSLLGRSNNFTKEIENRLCDIERRLAAIETQSAPPRENNNG